MSVATDTVLSKSVATALLAHTQLASGGKAIGSAIDVSSKIYAACLIMMGRTVTTALTNECTFRIEGSFSAAADDAWVPIYTWTSANGKTACNAPTLSGATSALAATYVVSSATGIDGTDDIYLRETGTPANSEWSKIKSISSTTVTPEDVLTRAHTNGITLTDLAERFNVQVNVAAYKRIRLIVDGLVNGTTGQAIDVIAFVNTLDKAVSTT